MVSILASPITVFWMHFLFVLYNVWVNANSFYSNSDFSGFYATFEYFNVKVHVNKNRSLYVWERRVVAEKLKM